MKFLRKLRGAMGTALLWTVAWIPVGVVCATSFWIYFRLSNPNLHEPSMMLAVIVAAFAVWGFISGTLFAMALAVSGSKRGGLDAFTVSQVSVWGALSGIVVPIFYFAAGVGFLPAAILGALSAIVGATLAAGTLKLAQRSSTLLVASSTTPALQTLD